MATIPGGDWPSYDSSGTEVSEIARDCFIEVGLNVSQLLGISDPAFEYDTVQLRTATDLAFAYFGESN